MSDQSSGAVHINGTRDLTVANRRLVLQCLLDTPTVSRVTISKRTGLAPASVYRLSRALVKSGLAEEAGANTTTGGRPSMMLRFNPDARRILAVDVTPAGIHTATVNLRGDLRDKQFIPVSARGEEAIAGPLVNHVAQCVQDAADDPFVSIGVSIPGPVTDDGVITVAPSLGWEELPLKEMFEARIGQPVTVENDMNLFAYAEWVCGANAEEGTIAVLGVYHGIGVGIVENEQIWRGSGGAAGQIGRMYMDAEAFSKRGKEFREFGQTEALLGASAIRQRAVNAGLISAKDGTLRDLFEAVGHGDPRPADFIDEVLTGFAFQIANLSAIIAPETIILAGVFEEWADIIIPILTEKLEGNVLQGPRLEASSLRDDAKLIGAGLYSLAARGGILSLA